MNKLIEIIMQISYLKTQEISMHLSKGRLRTSRKHDLMIPLMCFLISMNIASAHADENDGIRWETRVLSIQGDQIAVKLMMATGNCTPPPMDCDSKSNAISNGLSVSGSCTTGSSMYGSASEEWTITNYDNKHYEVGQNVDVWIGDGAPTFVIPSCLTEN